MTKDEVLDIHNPDDTGYKLVLSSKQVFYKLLKSFITEGWVNEIDTEEMIKVDKSYILQDFSKKEADLVYMLKFKGQDVIFYILLEMQSTVDFQMPYRLLLYMVEIWRDVVKNSQNEAERKDFRLPPIVPMVLYNGQNNWTACRSFKEMLSEYRAFGKYILDFEYILIDVNRLTEEKLLELSNVISAMLLLDQSSSEEEFLHKFLKVKDILVSLANDEFQLFRTWFEFIATRELNDTMKEKVIKVLEESNPKEENNMEHAIERIFREIRLEHEQLEKKCVDAKLEGKLDVVKNLLCMGLDTRLVSKAADLSEDDVKRIKEELVAQH